MKLHLFRVTGLIMAAVLFSYTAQALPFLTAKKATPTPAEKKATPAPDKKPASIADKKPAADKKGKGKATPAPTDQLEAARTATKKLPALAIDATIKREKFELHLKIKRVGEDWEMAMAGKQPMNAVRKDGSYYISDDQGKTWRPTQPDDYLVTAVMAPLENGRLMGTPPRRPIYESLGTEKNNDLELLHLRLVPDAGDKVDVKNLPEEWLVSDGKKGWLLRRSRSLAILFKQLVNADVTYEALPNDTTIEAPTVNAPAKKP